MYIYIYTYIYIYIYMYVFVQFKKCKKHPCKGDTF